MSAPKWFLLLLFCVGSASAVDVRLDVDVNNATDLAGFQMSVQFSQALSFLSSTEGSFLSQGGVVNTLFIDPYPTNSTAISDILGVRIPEYVINSSNYTIAKPTITINFSDVINTVPQYFYGAVLTGAEVNGSDIWPVAGGPGVKSDFMWHRTMLGLANVNYGRADMGFECVMPNSNRVTKKTGASALCNINLRREQVKYQYDTGGKFLLIAAYMPAWLSDNSSNCVSNRNRCMPSNMTTWTEIVLQYIDEVTLNGTYADAVEVEIWNEPYLDIFFLPDGTKEERAAEYSRLYNATYAAIKAKYPNMRVGGPCTTYGYGDGPYFGDYFFNVTDPDTVDFVTIHEYGENNLAAAITKAMNKLRSHPGWGQKPVKITEWEASNANVMINQTDNYMRYMQNAVMRVLNTEPTIETLVWYQWQEPNKYSQGAPYFSEWPKNFNMVSEPNLDNTTYVGFDLYNQFGDTYHRGSDIVRSNSTNAAITVMGGSSFGGNRKHFTYTDSALGATNVTVRLIGANAVSLTDMSDASVVYPVVNGYATIPGTSFTRSFQVDEAVRPPLGIPGSGNLFSLRFNSTRNVTPSDFTTSVMLSDSLSQSVDPSIISYRLYNDGLLWNVSQNPVVVPVLINSSNSSNSTNITSPPSNSSNSTNITLPVDNSTNVTLPVTNSTNVTLPVDNSTNITVPVSNSTNVSAPLDNITWVDAPISVEPPELNGGGLGGAISRSSEVIAEAASLPPEDREPLKIGSSGVRVAEKTEAAAPASGTMVVAAVGGLSVIAAFAFIALL